MSRVIRKLASRNADVAEYASAVYALLLGIVASGSEIRGIVSIGDDPREFQGDVVPFLARAFLVLMGSLHLYGIVRRSHFMRRFFAAASVWGWTTIGIAVLMKPKWGALHSGSAVANFVLAMAMGVCFIKLGYPDTPVSRKSEGD